MRIQALLLVAGLAVLAPTRLTAQSLPQPDPAEFDRDASGTLDYSEAVELFSTALSRDPRAGQLSRLRLIQVAEDRAEDEVTRFGNIGIPLAQVRPVSAIRATELAPATEEKARPLPWPCSGFAFKRSVTDAIDPRRSKTAAPVVFSVLRNEEVDEGKERDQYTLLGGVQVCQLQWSLRPHHFLTFTPGVDLTSNGSDPVEKTTIAGGLSLAWDWTGRTAGGLVSGTTLVLTPRFITDRDFDREIAELGLSLTISSEVLRSGYYRYFGSELKEGGQAFRWTWLPVLGLAAGEVEDAGGNELLLPLEGGSYTRAKGALSASIRYRDPNRRLPVSLILDLQNVVDLREDTDRSFGEVSLQHDLNRAGTIQLTLAYRKGRKEPDFAPKDEILFGLGVLLIPK